MSPLTLTPQPSFQTQVGLGKEALGAWGTAVSTTAYFPVEKPKFEDVPKWLYDRGYRGIRSRTFAVKQGVLVSQFEVPDMKFYPDDSGHFLYAVTGSDVVTGSNPYTHTLTQTAALPNSYTLTDFSGLSASARQYTGCYIEEVTLKYSADGDLFISAKGQGKPSTLVAKPTASYSTQSFLLGWQAVLTLAGQVNARIMGMTYTIKQILGIIWGGNNQQAPTAINVGPIEVTGQMDVEPNDETEFLYMLNNTQPTASLNFTSGTNQLTIQTTTMAFTKGPIDRSGEYVKLPLTFEAVYNATDAGTEKLIVVNPRSAGY
jgi:hypothetical protein